MKRYISYIIISITLITLLKPTISKTLNDNLSSYFEYMTLDKIRQVYWSIICDINENNKTASSSLPEELQKKSLEFSLHSMNRKTIMINLSKTLAKISYNFDEYINQIENKFNIISPENITVDFPKNFLINFALNIDKNERVKKLSIDSISDYINFYTKEQIIDYIKSFEDLNDSNYIKSIVLNDNKYIKYKDLNSYYQSKNENELINIIYGFENYVFNILENEDILSYKIYDHSDLANKKKEDLMYILAVYNKEIYGKEKEFDLDDFITTIEYHNFHYININENLDKLSDDKLANNLLALEKYYKRQNNLTKSLRQLTNYVKNIGTKYKKKILIWGLNLYPELIEEGRFEDVISNERNLQYGQVKQFVQVTDRDILIKYAFNIHSYQNKLESIYDKDLFDLYRYINEDLYELILYDTNQNKDLQEKSFFSSYADLHKDDLNYYLKNLQRNQLKKIALILIDEYYNRTIIEEKEIPSKKLTTIENTINLDTQKLINEIKEYMTDLQIDSTSSFFEQNFNFIGYYENIMDFFRSTDKFYLKLWLRKYEIEFRNQNEMNYIEGGLRTNFLNDNEYTKENLLEIFDIYLEKNITLFFPQNFIKIVGLDNDITPHNYLVNLSLENTEESRLQLKYICYAIIGHYQRKNLFLSFDGDDFLKKIKNILEYEYENYITNNFYLYQIFRLMNIFPELLNYKFFNYICIDENTKVINLKKDNNMELYFKRGKSDIATNIQYYYNHIGIIDNKNIGDMNAEELKKYITDFDQNPNFIDNYELKSRVFDGDFFPILYDYYENYLTTLSVNYLKDVFYIRFKITCMEGNYQCIISNATERNEIVNNIVENIKRVKEFQRPEFFDKYFDYIDDGFMKNDPKRKELYEFLENTNNRDLLLYCLLTSIIEKENKDDATVFYLKIHYMSRYQMIRYILNTHEKYENFKEMLNPQQFPILIKKYKLDIGSDNIYDLSMY